MATRSPVSASLAAGPIAEDPVPNIMAAVKESSRHPTEPARQRGLDLALSLSWPCMTE
jgi:hypothetical protein